MNIIEEILADIRVLKDSLNINLPQGLEIQQRLAANSMFLATSVGDAAKDRNELEYMYKSSVNTFMVTYKGEKLSEKRLEALAREQYKGLYKDLTDAETLYNRLTLILRQTNVNIETLRQTNSQLKVEYKSSREFV